MPSFERRAVLVPAFAASTVSGVLYAAAQPDRGFWWLAPIALVPLLLALRHRPLGWRLALGGCTGGVAGLAIVLGPTGNALSSYFDVAPWQGGAVAAGLALLFGAVPFAGFAALVGGGRCPGALRVATALILAELMRSTFFTGLPWALLAHALTPVPELLGAARLGGEELLSALVAGANAGVASLSVAGSRRAGAIVILSCALLLLAPGWLASTTKGGGLRELRPGQTAARGELAVALVQPQVARAARATETLGERLAELAAETPGPLDLVVWPESAVPVVLPENLDLLNRALAAAAPPPSAWLLGAPRSDPTRPGPVANAALLIDAEGRVLGAHEKVRLVPFTERAVPGAGRLGLRTPATRRGTAPSVLDLDGVLLGPLICYEALFSRITMAQVRAGASVLVSLSNDEWFGSGRGLEQHFAPAVLRAVETGRPLLRATNTGITAAVDSRGRVVARLPAGRRGVLRVAVTPGQGITPATRLAGLWVVAAPLGWLLSAASTRRRVRARENRQPPRESAHS